MHRHKFWKKKQKKLHYNKFKLFLTFFITKFLEFSYEKWENNKTVFGQISGFNKEIKFYLLSFL